MFLILPLTLRSFNRAMFFTSKRSPHAAISKPYCIFFYFFLFVVTCWMFVLLPLTLQSFSRPILFLSILSSQDAISKPYCIFFYFFLFVVTCWMFVLLPLTLRSFNQPILFISKWSPHAYKSMSPCMFCVNFHLFWPVENLILCRLLFEVSTGRYFHIQMKPSCC